MVEYFRVVLKCLEAVRHQPGMPLALEIGAIIMDWVIVPAEGLKGGKQGGCHCARGRAKHLSDPEFVKGARWVHLVIGGIKAHGGSVAGLVSGRQDQPPVGREKLVDALWR